MVTRLAAWSRANLTYSNLMSTIAVFAVLGGTAYAAGKLAKNSVGTAQLKNNAVTTPKVKDGSLLAKDFKTGELPAGAKGDKGDPGRPGDPGTPGVPGKDGANAATSVLMRRVIQPVNSMSAGTATAACVTGERMISGGGGWVNSITEDLDIPRTVTTLSYNGPATGNVPAGDTAAPAGWTVAGNNNNGFGDRLYAYAICASP